MRRYSCLDLSCAEDSPPASRDGTSTATTTVGSGSDPAGSDPAATTRTDASTTTTQGGASTQGTTPATTADQPTPDTTTAETRATVPGEYDLGAFTGTDIWVDPNAGDDENDGHDRVNAMRTVDAAWRMIPSGRQLDVGYRDSAHAGRYLRKPTGELLGDRHGTATAPIIAKLPTARTPRC